MTDLNYIIYFTFSGSIRSSVVELDTSEFDTPLLFHDILLSTKYCQIAVVVAPLALLSSGILIIRYLLLSVFENTAI